MPSWRVRGVVTVALAALMMVGCSRGADTRDTRFGGLDGRYEGTVTMSHGGVSKTLGITMIFEPDGALTSHSELDEPQHSYYRLAKDHTAIEMYDTHKILYGHVQVIELTAEHIKGVLLPDNGTRDIGTTNVIDVNRVTPSDRRP